NRGGGGCTSMTTSPISRPRKTSKGYRRSGRRAAGKARQRGGLAIGRRRNGKAHDSCHSKSHGKSGGKPMAKRCPQPQPQPQRLLVTSVCCLRGLLPNPNAALRNA